MAIQHRALLAVSLAFVASLVAYPDLSGAARRFAYDADGPQVFVGRPLIAFVLPIAAAMVWWLLTHLHRQSPVGAHAAREAGAGYAGAATALFLSAFHVAMLIGVLGAHAWLGRILGAMVGLFLIATGNELPRLRPNLAWGIRTRQTLGDDRLWKRVHRLGGFIRVGFGAAICVASLAGVQELATLILVAVALETVVCIGAALFLSPQPQKAASARC